MRSRLAVVDYSETKARLMRSLCVPLWMHSWEPRTIPFLNESTRVFVYSNAPLLSSFLDMASDVLLEILEASMTVGPV
jgi:hypothetical protein